ncbi:MAG: DUF5317 domain-containing protein [Caldicoprobacterales bacterium]|jgi:hypothetical protein|nr:DUF5317 domain-containing protein [Clostridiales bacterium]
MFYAVIAAAVLTGLLRGGRITNLARVKLVYPWLAILSVAMDATLLLLIKYEFTVTQTMAFISLSIQYALLFLFIWFNRYLPYSWLIGIGVFLNALVILINGGSMPLAEAGAYLGKYEYANQYLMEGKFITYHIINENTKLWFLGDIIWFPPPFRVFMSIGDIILYAGAFLIIQNLIAAKSRRNKHPVFINFLRDKKPLS